MSVGVLRVLRIGEQGAEGGCDERDLLRLQPDVPVNVIFEDEGRLGAGVYESAIPSVCMRRAENWGLRADALSQGVQVA